MGNLLISGNTMEEWDINTILEKNKVFSRKNDRERIVNFELDRKIGQFCGGLSYEEINLIDASHNFWKY